MQRNVVLVCLDSVRNDTFLEYADHLRSNASLEFTQCRAASSWSVPSHASLCTGLLPSSHGIHTGNCDYSLLDANDTFLSSLPDHKTVGVSANPWAGSAFGFDDLFDEFYDISLTKYFTQGIDVRSIYAENSSDYYEFLSQALAHDNTIVSLANGAITKLDSLTTGRAVPKLLDYGGSKIAKQVRQFSRDSEPFFVFTNFMEAHTPHEHVWGYDKSIHDVDFSWSSYRLDAQEINVNGAFEENREEIESFRELYAASVEYLDRLVSSLVENIMESTNLETTVIVTADHGENLAYPDEDRLFGHKSSLFEGLLHVPLIIINPPEGTDVDTSAYLSHLEIGELIHHIARGEMVDPTSEFIPAELMGMGFDTWEVDEEQHRWWNRMQRCAYHNETKIQWDSLGNVNEYQIDREQPSRQQFVSERKEPPQWAIDLFELDIGEYDPGYSKDPAESGDKVDSGTKDRLRDLGYL